MMDPCAPLPVVGGPLDGATFTPLFDAVPGRWVRLGTWQEAGGGRRRAIPGECGRGEGRMGAVSGRVKCNICDARFTQRAGDVYRRTCRECVRVCEFIEDAHGDHHLHQPVAGQAGRVERYRERVEAGERLFEATPGRV